MTIGVVGAGLIGGSMIKKWSEQHSIMVADKKAVPSHKNVMASSLEEIAGKCSIVWVAVPAQQAPSVINELLQAGAPLVADVCSVKRNVVSNIPKAMHERYIGTHPMAGRERGGWKNSSADLLEGCTWAITSRPEIDDLLVATELIDAFKAKMVLCSAEVHDRAVAASSHAIQIIQTIIAASLPIDEGPGAALSGPGLRDSTRLAASNLYPMWDEIISSNADYIEENLEVISQELESLDLSNLDDLWARGSHKRHALMQTRWQDPLWKEASVEATEFWPLVEKRGSSCLYRYLRREGDKITMQISTQP